MASSLSSNQLLISALAKRQRSKNPLQAGFTLIELLVVIIIIGILAAIALPSFLNQADKAKGNSAKSLASSAAKECQVWLVDQDPSTFTQTTGGSGQQVTLAPAQGSTTSCSVANGGTFTATVTGKNWTYTAAVTSAGAVSRSCSTGGYGCTTTS
ncbi:prepilin-type N-terminal cleavage/methylation domain-containing protein, partial [Cyanobium sp. T1B-Tous]|uniref:prepilin-type N-terminal cleavage/methylation domain-containing protein n=1 Tax=Cyanobium sp. T1B-Tous TaxID=2823721 RepID=UPI0020CF8629